MNEQIAQVLREIKRLMDLSPKYRLYPEEYLKWLRKQGYNKIEAEGISSSFAPWFRDVGIKITTFNFLMILKMNQLEFEAILGKLQEEGYIDTYMFVDDEVGGIDNYFQIVPSKNFEALYKTAMGGNVEREVVADPEQLANAKTRKLLEKLAPDLERRYMQIIFDIADEYRLSYTGTAGELREIITKILHAEAPDAAVEAQDWYKQAIKSDKDHPDTPTRRERVKYIMLKKNQSGSVETAAKTSDLIEGILGEIVAASYARLSAAAHGSKAREELIKCLGYFDAFVADLL